MYLRLIISFRIPQVSGSKVARQPNNRPSRSTSYLPNNLRPKRYLCALSPFLQHLPIYSVLSSSLVSTPLQFLPYRLAGPSYTRPWQTSSKSFAMSETSEIRGAKSQAVVIAHSLGTSCKVGFGSQICILFISTALNWNLILDCTYCPLCSILCHSSPIAAGFSTNK